MNTLRRCLSKERLVLTRGGGLVEASTLAGLFNLTEFLIKLLFVLTPYICPSPSLLHVLLAGRCHTRLPTNNHIVTLFEVRWAWSRNKPISKVLSGYRWQVGIMFKVLFSPKVLPVHWNGFLNVCQLSIQPQMNMLKFARLNKFTEMKQLIICLPMNI